MKVLALANLYRADHMAQVQPYRPMNPAASSWNTALFGAMADLGADLDLHIAQFVPTRRYRVIREGRFTFHYLPRLPWLDGFTSQAKRLRVAALVRELRPDAVHGIGSEHGYAWAAVGHGAPSAVTIHGFLRVINRLPGHTSRLKQWFLVPEEARALRGADRVVAINEYMQGRFIDEGGCPRERTVVIPNALNPVFLQPWDEAPRPIDLIIVGTLHPLKNQHVALDLFSRLARDHGQRPRVVVVGTATADSAAYGQHLQSARASLGLDNVEFAGRKTAQELFALYRQSRFLLHISSFEADPTVVAEAQACGALPVVNPVAGLAHRVQDARNGWHLPIDNAASAAARLVQLLSDEPARARLAGAARGAVLSQRHPASVAGATVELYGSLAAHPPLAVPSLSTRR